MLLDRIYLVTAFAFFALFVIGMVGLVSPAWRSGHYGSYQYVDSGLVMRCHHDLGMSFHRCAPFSMGSQAVWFEVSRVFCCVTLTFLFALVVAACFLHYTDKHKEDYVYIMIAAIFTGTLGVVGAVVYAVKSFNQMANVKTDLSWGWAVFLADVLTVVALSCLLIGWIKSRKRKPKLKQVTPLRG